MRALCMAMIAVAWLGGAAPAAGGVSAASGVSIASGMSIAGGAGPVQDAPEAPQCRKCASTGRLPCKEHPKNLCEAEDSVLYCSVIATCAECAGVGWMPCTECVNEPARAAMEAKKADVATRKITLAALDEKMGRELCKAETKHAIVVWELPRHKVDRKFLDQHEGLHLYAQRLESMYSDYIARLQVTDKDFREKFKVFVWWLPEDQMKGSIAFCGQGATGGVKLMGNRPSYSVCGNKQNFQDDEKLYRNIVHCVAHLLLSAQQSPQWIGNIKGGWADEGLAHWFEDRYWGMCDTYCYQEANTNVDFKSGRWKPAVRKLVEMDKAPPAAVVFDRNIDTLTLAENAVAFSYVDYLLGRDGAKFSQLVAELKKKVPTRDAMKQVYGFGPLEFEAMWKAWVVATYPAK